MPSYPLYSVELDCESELPGLQAITFEAGRFLTTLHLQIWPTHTGIREVRQGSAGVTYVVLETGALLIHYGDGTRFFISADNTQIWADWLPESATLEDTSTYLLGPVMGCVLRRLGKICLHASSAVLHQHAVLFMGNAGAGKSTLVSAFAIHGRAAMTEDVACLTPEVDGRFFLEPGYPLARLWPASAEILFGKPDALPLLTPNWDKRYLALGSDKYRFESERRPISTVFALGERRDMSEAAVFIPMTAREALIEATTHSYGNRILTKEQRAHEFGVLAALTARVPMWRLHLNADPSRLKEACDVIEAFVADQTHDALASLASTAL